MKTDEFLNPKSMLTPGIAGGIVMLIANTLLAQFALPARWTSLVLSFLLGLIVFRAVAIPLLHRVIFYLFNSLIIFSVAVGTNTVGAKLPDVTAAIRQTATTLKTQNLFFKEWFPKKP